MEIATIRGVSNAPTVDAHTLEVVHYNLAFFGEQAKHVYKCCCFRRRAGFRYPKLWKLVDKWRCGGRQRGRAI